MPRFSFRVFVWIFGISNGIVWFGIAFAVAHLLGSSLGGPDGLSRHQALWALCLTPLATSILSVQGAVVNLRAQYLEGRFTLPRLDAGAERRKLTSPWVPAGQAGIALWLLGLPILFGAGWWKLPPAVPARVLGVTLGSFAAFGVLAATLSVGIREFHTFAARLGPQGTKPRGAGPYLGWQLAMPWGVVNCVINAALGWVGYHRFFAESPPHVPFGVFRTDLVIMSIALSVLIPMAAMPEAQCDAAVGTVQISATLPTMPTSRRRLLLVLAIGLAVWTAVTLMPILVQRDALNAWTAVTVKALWGGALAAACAGLWAGWTLAQSRNSGPTDRTAGTGQQSTPRTVMNAPDPNQLNADR
jgi:hypothetical protein